MPNSVHSGKLGAHSNQRNGLLLVTLAYLVQAILITFAILAVLVGIKTLPLSYVIVSLNITHLAFAAVQKLFITKVADTHTMLSLLLAMVTVVCGITSV